ncbi:MAG: hypothetical protein HGGPFJEG_02469 [Ignavibacteria bacterium]|nr:hypothetical protein [Ignavibacteria bacterium]
MTHPIYKILSIKIIAPYTLELMFDDNTVKKIDFRNILHGEMFTPLKDLKLFNQVKIDPEVFTIVWPNGADFDPALLHDWEKHEKELVERLTLKDSIT